MTIAVQVDRQNVSVTMTVAERFSLFIAAGEFRALNAPSLCHAPDDRPMQKFGLGQRPTARRQCRPIAARRSQSQQHHLDATDRVPRSPLGHSHFQRTAAPPVDNPLRTRRLGPAMLLPPSSIFQEAIDEVFRIRRDRFRPILK